MYSAHVQWYASYLLAKRREKSFEPSLTKFQAMDAKFIAATQPGMCAWRERLGYTASKMTGHSRLSTSRRLASMGIGTERVDA